MSDSTSESLRADFIKRLFSVAASVGFATQIGKQDWLIEGRSPNVTQMEGLLLLVSSIVVVVASWEGYFEAISEVKLSDKARFYIDIIIIIEYIILLDATFNQRVWQLTLTAIWFSYFIWDIFTCIASGSYWKTFRPHSLCWLLSIFVLALLVIYGPFHPFRYTIASLISVVLFRKKFQSYHFVKHLGFALSSVVLCFIVRNLYL